MATILGIDPGSRITGFGVIKAAGSRIEYLASGCIKVKAESLGARLDEIYSGISQIIDSYQPDQAAIEQIFMFYNAQSALKLGQARGVALVSLARALLPAAEYSAKQVKQAVVGYGSASKSQVQHMVQQLLGLKSAPQSDAADALAIALCHHHTGQSLKQLDCVSKIVRGRWQ